MDIKYTHLVSLASTCTTRGLKYCKQTEQLNVTTQHNNIHRMIQDQRFYNQPIGPITHIEAQTQQIIHVYNNYTLILANDESVLYDIGSHS